jgi:hypothetical protein
VVVVGQVLLLAATLGAAEVVVAVLNVEHYFQPGLCRMYYIFQ